MTDEYVEFPLLDDKESAPITPDPEPEVPVIPEPEPEPTGPVYETDWYGTYEVINGSRILIERSTEYLAQVMEQEVPEEELRTQEDYMLDLDFRLLMIEMGM